LDITVLTNPRCVHKKRIEETVHQVNQLQTYFTLTCRDADWLTNDVTENTFASGNAEHAKIARHFRERYVIAITQSGIDRHADLLTDERSHASLVTMAGWVSEYAPPPLGIFLMFEFASAMLSFTGGLSDEQINDWSHYPAIGCVFDWYKNVQELKRCMVAANLCGRCEVRLAEMGMPDQALTSIEQILAYVRAATMRRPRNTASAVFIGHGHSKAWVDVRDFVVKTLKLPVQEFNQEAAAGISTIDRLESMLDASAFAVLVMTGEDRFTSREGKQAFRARENVVHEIGLFQGRLGFRRAIVLAERSLPIFSNLLGLTTIQFRRGKFKADREAQKQLRSALSRERILMPLPRRPADHRWPG
jgi:Predicted nucleotide-binding protein containing TIR -like domain